MIVEELIRQLDSMPQHLEVIVDAGFDAPDREVTGVESFTDGEGPDLVVLNLGREV
jgi:hypothetical protein